MGEDLVLLNGKILAHGYERVVHGDRGDYVEFTKDQLILPLKSKFGQDIPDSILGTENYYFYWLVPTEGIEYKIYWQIKIVQYADYKIGYYYIEPGCLKNQLN